MIASPHLSPALTLRGSWRERALDVLKGRAVQGVAMAALLAAAGAVYVYRGVIVDNVQDFVARATGAEVASVVVEGAAYTAKDDLLAALNVQKGEPLVGFNTLAARERLEALPWVRLAAVEKQLPQGLHVVVYEHVPLARVLNDDGEIWVVNKNGAPVVEDTENRFAALPLLDGAGAAGAAAKLFGMLAEWPNLTAQMKSASYVGERRWDLVFSSGVTVQLPEENAYAALGVLAELERARHVLSLPAGEVDLRLPDRVVLRIPPDVGKTPVTDKPATQG